MADTSSVYKICPHCGQASAVSARVCPICDTPFADEDTDFVAYERYSEPALHPPPPLEDPAGGQTMAEKAAGDGGSAPPPMGGKRDGDGRSKGGLIVTIVAAVLLVAVIGVGVYLAFRMGIVGGGEDADPMTMAQEAYSNREYDDAIARLEQMLQNGTADADTYDLMARCFEAQGKTELAAETYLQGYEATKDSTLKKSAIDAYLRLGDKARKDGDDPAARAHYNTVLELDPSNSTAISGLSRLSADTAVTPSPTPTAESGASPSPSPVVIASDAPVETEKPVVEETETAVVTPTAAPSPSPAPAATPSPSPKPTAVVTPTAAPSPSPKPTPTPTAAPSPSPTPAPSPSPTPAPSPSPTPVPSPSPTPEPDPITFSYDGHSYELVISDGTWWQAVDDAKAKGGHLLTINSEGELAECGRVAGDNGVIFLRLYAARDNWENGEWSTGERFDYAPWYDGEPSGGDEQYLSMFRVSGSWYFNDTTNDVSDYAGKKGYIIEYD